MQDRLWLISVSIQYKRWRYTKGNEVKERSMACVCITVAIRPRRGPNNSEGVERYDRNRPRSMSIV